MADRSVQHRATVAVAILGLVAGLTSYHHMIDLADAYDLDQLTTLLWPVSADGLVVVSTLCLLDDSRAGRGSDKLARLGVFIGLALSLWANSTAGDAGWAPGKHIISGSTAVAFFLAFELAMRRHRIHHAEADTGHPDTATDTPAAATTTRVDTPADTRVAATVNTDQVVTRMPTRPRAAAAAMNTGHRVTTAAAGGSKSDRIRRAVQDAWSQGREVTATEVRDELGEGFTVTLCAKVLREMKAAAA